MTLPALNFECYQMESGVWCKRRPDGRRGACVADEAILWQHLQAALGRKPPPGVDVKELVKENEQLNGECERLLQEMDRLCSQGNEDVVRLHTRVAELVHENEQLAAAYEGLLTRYESLEADWVALGKEAEELRANQRQKPGRKPRRSNAAGAPEQALAASEQEQDPLNEDL